jgi:hypothetical protein
MMLVIGGETVELPVVYRKFVGDKEWADSIISDNYDRLSDEISSEREMKVVIRQWYFAVISAAGKR